MDRDSQRLRDVLAYWHKVEFFIPYDMDEKLDQPNAPYLLREENLTRGNDALPWLSANALRFAGGALHKRYRYTLYLVLFPKSELNALAELKFGSLSNELDQIEQNERTALEEGRTCFARLRLDEDGRPDFECMELSTLPWALRQLREDQLSHVTYDAYRMSVQKLSEQLRLLATHLCDPSTGVVPDAQDGILTIHGLSHLCKLLMAWADFAPADEPLVAVDLLELPRPQDGPQMLSAPPAVLPNDDIAEIALPDGTETESEPEAEPHETQNADAGDEPEDLAILNSFFIEDIELVMRVLALGSPPRGLRDYGLGLNVAQRVNLLTPEGSRIIVEHTRPDKMNRGRWPSADDHLMSLMQQFAINTVTAPPAPDGIFSVNGPPGTGKTTMLRDIVADNLVRRARVLASLNQSGDAFVGDREVSFGEQTQERIRLLDDRLTGFEMIVASSNNVAVENISKDLPLPKALGEGYEDTHYLQAVAAKVFAEHTKDRVKPLAKDAKPWGLVSVALGRAANRRRFRERLFFAPEGKEMAQTRIDKGEYLTIWEWKRTYRGPSFGAARSAFLKSAADVDDFMEVLGRYAELIHRLGGHTRDSYCEEEAHKMAEATRTLAEADAQLSALAQQLHAVRKVIENSHRRAQLHRARQPSRWRYVMFWKAAAIYREFKTHRDEAVHLNQQEFEALEQESQYMSQQRKAADLQAICDRELQRATAAYHEKVQAYEALHQTLRDIALQVDNPPAPGVDVDLEQREVQINGFWQNKALNHRRTRLFIEALQLHEAWLADVLDRHRFQANLMAISHVLDGRRPTHDADLLPIWQSFFMWVPVVSSTFASVARQFAGLDSGALGWLFIDEAGQAVPQAAVGAIWRAKRTIAVGDPLQIEPVFTIPKKLVENLAKTTFSEAFEKWAPTLVSVQTLADAANPLGATFEINAQPTWVGSPLRVHRRCSEPMFSIANEIAYNDKMILGTADGMASKWLHALGESTWYHVEGETIDKQYVSEQGQVALTLFSTAYRAHGQLPPLYFISPFRRVRLNLTRLIRQRENWVNGLDLPTPTDAEVRRWCRAHIGTVHTFQGKEEAAVVFILGADHQSPGSANWAARKPNLLNVAVTRAIERVYIVGDMSLWAQRPYFRTAARALPSSLEFSAPPSVFL